MSRFSQNTLHRSFVAQPQMDSPPRARMQRSLSEPIVPGLPSSPLGEGAGASPLLRATSRLHQLHQSDMEKYRLESGHGRDWLDAVREAVNVPGDLRRAVPGDLRRAESHNTARTDLLSQHGRRQAKLVHTANTGNLNRQPEQAFVMPHPYQGHAPRETPAHTRTAAFWCPERAGQLDASRDNHKSKPKSARRRRAEILKAPVDMAALLPGSWTRLTPTSLDHSFASSLQRPLTMHQANSHADISDDGERCEEEVEIMSILTLYNSIVVGLAGRLLVDTRDADDYDERHVTCAIDVDESLTYLGKHIILISQNGEIGPVQRRAIAALHKKQGMLSLKNVEGGMNAWVQEYPFLCERTAASVEEEFQQRRARSAHMYPSQVLPWLYISGVEPAQDSKVLSDLNMTHVLSITADPEKVRVPKFCKRHMIALRDEPESDIAAHFDEAWEFISEVRATAGGRLLVHCKMGRSRSACLVLMGMFRSAEFTLSSAWHHLRACRKQIAVNAGFVKQLIELEGNMTRRRSTVEWDERRGQIVLS